MKTLRNTFVVALIAIVAASCGSKQEQTEPITNDSYETNTALTVSIEGMTCAVGCAKTIQSKIAEIPGVTFSTVDFEANEGLFKYDANTVSEDEILNTITGLADGQYKPTVVKVEKVSGAKTEEPAQEEEAPEEVPA